MIRTVKVSEKGQIAIPQMIRENLGIGQGDELIMFQVDGKILMEKSEKTKEKMRENFKDILKFSEKSLRSVWNNKEDEIWSNYLK